MGRLFRAGGHVIAAAGFLAMSACITDSCNPDAPTKDPVTVSTKVQSVAVTGTAPGTGATAQFKATATLSNSTTQDVTALAVWQSSNPSVARVAAGGSVTGVAAGDADLTATYSDVSGRMHVTIAGRTAVNLKSFVGCYAAGATSAGIGCGRMSTLGSAAEDALFTSEIQYQSSFWNGVPATVYVYNECTPDQKNAVAIPDRSINFGYYMYRSLISQYPDGLPIAGVMAHEWGHQVQFANGWMTPNQSTIRPTELEADAFSGYYMGLYKQFAWSFINSYFAAVYSFGEYNFNSPGHHGTPDERLAAARMGFDTAVSVSRSGQGLSYAQLHGIFAGAIGTAILSRLSTSSVAGDPDRVLSPEQIDGIVSIAQGRSRGDEAIVQGSFEARRALFPRP